MKLANRASEDLYLHLITIENLPFFHHVIRPTASQINICLLSDVGVLKELSISVGVIASVIPFLPFGGLLTLILT